MLHVGTPEWDPQSSLLTWHTWHVGWPGTGRQQHLMAQGFQCQKRKARSKGQAHALKVWCFMCLSQVQRPLRSRVLDDDHMLLALCSLGGPHSERRDSYPRGVCAAALPCSCSVRTKLRSCFKEKRASCRPGAAERSHPESGQRSL